MNLLRVRGCFRRCMKNRGFKGEGLGLVEEVEVVEGVEVEDPESTKYESGGSS